MAEMRVTLLCAGVAQESPSTAHDGRRSRAIVRSWDLQRTSASCPHVPSTNSSTVPWVGAVGRASEARVRPSYRVWRVRDHQTIAPRTCHSKDSCWTAPPIVGEDVVRILRN